MSSISFPHWVHSWYTGSLGKFKINKYIERNWMVHLISQKIPTAAVSSNVNSFQKSLVYPRQKKMSQNEVIKYRFFFSSQKAKKLTPCCWGEGWNIRVFTAPNTCYRQNKPAEGISVTLTIKIQLLELNSPLWLDDTQA